MKTTLAHTFFATNLDDLVPKNHKKRKILDQIDWSELVFISKEAYKSGTYQESESPRVMIGLFVYSCLSDKTYEEVAEDFSFNALCQYACGLTEMKSCFIDDTTLLKFEQRLGDNNILAIKDIIEKAAVDAQPPRSKGTHSLDTTVFESNITFPTDTKLMEAVRCFLVDVIATYEGEVNQEHRHYGRVARRDYVDFSKNRNPSHQRIRKQKKKALQYLRRNLAQTKEVILALKEQAETKQEKKFVKKLHTKLLIAEEIYKQQRDLFHGKEITGRIVSFHRPEVRPIFRGKAGKKTEFGVKTEISIHGKALLLGKMSYDNFYDGHGMKESILSFKEKGYPVKEAIGDKGNGGQKEFLVKENIKNGIEQRGKRQYPKEVPKKRFIRERNKNEGAHGIMKRSLGLAKMRAKNAFGECVKICKACMGYNLRYAF